ncbi:thiamine pyrophosphate-dependent enzyme [Catenulispora sp. GAS73]|uniref:thiamine pyrophosphate-dependent enzyme n=1 Tax=Catenulispora sp. GAS73 TaxID=3156269 RepID=UPI0035132AC4
MVEAAIEASERCRIPVLIRVTPAMHLGCDRSRDRVDLLRGPFPRRSTPRIDAHVAHGLTKMGRVQHHRLVTLPTVLEVIAEKDLSDEVCKDCSQTAMIAVGAAARYLPDDDRCRMVVRASWPVTDDVVAFADRHPSTMVVEESASVTEEALRIRAQQPSRLQGRLSHHLPPDGSLTSEIVAKGLIGPSPTAWRDQESKTGSPPPGRYDTVFRAVARLHDTGVFVATDVGSSVRLCYPPHNGAEVALALGSAIGVANGVARTRRRAIGVIGDFGLLHTGIQPLIEAAAAQLPVLAVVLANGVQAQTGGQPVPDVDFHRLISACGVPHVEQWPLACMDSDATFARLSRVLRGALPAVVLITDKPSSR